MSSVLSYVEFIKTLPQTVVPHLPDRLQVIQPHQPFRWIIQFHFGEKRLHYEVSRVPRTKNLELAFHCESKDKTLNRYLLTGFRRHLFEIHDTLGQQITAEMWDRGWTKIYEVYPEGELTNDYQEAVGKRLAEIITCLQPIFAQLRQDVRKIHR